MPRIEPPAIQPMSKQQISDFERFAKAYFGIELTSWQLELIEALTRADVPLKGGKQMGKNTALKVFRAYIKEGIDPNGRARLPQFELPAHLGRTKTKAVTQSGRILELISRPGGAFNFELSRIALKYDSRIHELRHDGHAIICERQYLKNGKASNTFLYRLAGQL